MRKRRLAIPRGGGGTVNWVHVEDAASVTVAALERGQPGQAHNIVDDEPVNWRDFTWTLAEAYDTPRPFMVLIKGRCDYLSWSSAQEYMRALRDGRLLYLDGSGHNAYQDEPKRYMAEVRAFLLDRPLPERPYQDTGSPDDYEGPP